eukprot:TRINITY_DN529_c0_g1_i1.p1 TRINITY_DN529_c0_g1~~TRINITY_DN529_c0_g1_i1.p1  ORF type:complete len:386 (-),score=103.27 TRINITY_DN529_c0_g1_i1:899-2056(-)
MAEMKRKVITLKNHAVFPYCLPYIVVPAHMIGMKFGGLGCWTAMIIGFVLIPILDHFVGLDFANPASKEDERELSNRKAFRYITWVWVPFQLLFLIRATHMFMTRPMTMFEMFGMVVCTGLGSGALGINVAHELIHKSSYFEQLLGRFLLVQTCYGHFYVEHLQGHHKRVSTRDDPATARLGENFYAFWLRSVYGSFVSACHLEAARLRQAGLSAWSIHNEVIKVHTCSAILAGLFYWRHGPWGLAFFLMQSVVGFTFLELVNYIEHYGLERAIDAKTGQPVRVTPMHSWNTGYRISNYLLFKLQRHSDHHANAGRRYQILRSFENSPQLPQGYPAMLLVCVVPPLWYWLMDQRVLDYRRKTAEYARQGIDMFPEMNSAEVAPAR